MYVCFELGAGTHRSSYAILRSDSNFFPLGCLIWSAVVAKRSSLQQCWRWWWQGFNDGVDFGGHDEDDGHIIVDIKPSWFLPIFCLNHYAHSMDMYGHCMLDLKMVYGWVLDWVNLYLVLCWTYRMHDFFLHIDSGTTWALSTTWCGTMRKHRSISSLRSKWRDMMSQTRTIFGIWALLLGLQGEQCSQKQNLGEMVEQWGTTCYLEKSFGRGDESAKEWGL